MMVTARLREDLMADHSPAAEQSIGQAAGDLRAVQAFVNTRDIEQAADELASPAALAGWLRTAGLLDEQQATGPGPGQQDLELALRLREALRGVLRAHAGHGTAGDAVAELSKVAGSLRIRLEVFPDGQVRSQPAGRGVPAALARLLLIAAEAGTAGTWARLKACSADDCQWAFYDRSPTRNGCWCSMQICGSRAKSRAYRRRAALTASRSGRTAAPGA
jgi:predicted RNA-binding Zn ribbon-like protein